MSCITAEGDRFLRRRMSTTKLPFTDTEWKIPGYRRYEMDAAFRSPCRYTGYVEGVKETFKKTPILCQKECRQPEEGSFILNRTQCFRKTEAHSDDPCNQPDVGRKARPENLWPNLQHTAKRDPFLPPKSSVSLGKAQTSWRDRRSRALVLSRRPSH